MTDGIYVKPYFPPAGALKTPIRHLRLSENYLIFAPNGG